MNVGVSPRDKFLKLAGWADAVSVALASDASNRRYDRLTHADGNTAVLMYAPLDLGEDICPFIRAAAHLSSLGLSAPNILAKDRDLGLMLLEDFGDDLFARLVAADPTIEMSLYSAAIDVLVELRTSPLPNCPLMDAPAMADQIALTFKWYAVGAPFNSEPLRAEFLRLSNDRCLSLRDYHCENLIWLPHRTGTARVGLLDFQDAVITHPAYDLASLLKDARRDLGDSVAENGLSYYIAQTGVDEDRFRFDYALAAVQRNLRILGVFARLSLAYSKPHYLDFIPRVWGHIQQDLAHPELQNLRDLLAAALPEPTETHLAGLRKI